MSTVNPLDSIELDPGDMGLVFVPGVGFRPVDGVDAYGNGKADCEVVVVYKDLAMDQIEQVIECNDGPPVWTEKWSPPLEWIPSNGFAPPAYAVSVPPSTPTTWTPSTPWTPVTWCCTTTPWTPPSTPEIPPVPLPATGLLLSAALIGGIIIRAAQTLRLAASIKDQN